MCVCVCVCVSNIDYEFVLPMQSDYRRDRQTELICCSIEGEGII